MPPHNPTAKSSHFVSLQVPGPGYLCKRSAGALWAHKDRPINTPSLGNQHYLFRNPPKDENGNEGGGTEDVGRDEGDQWKCGV